MTNKNSKPKNPPHFPWILPMKEKKVILITGVSRGLGNALAFELSKRGNIIAGCSRTAEKLKILEAGLGKGHYFQACDVTSDEQVKKFCSVVVEKVGVPDIIINCAGQLNKSSKLWEVSAQTFDFVIDTNLKGTANMIRHFLPVMIAKNPNGIIVNFSSSWGRTPAGQFAPYAASKWAIEGMTKSLAMELPVGFVAVALNPGAINTDMLKTCFGEETANFYTTPDVWAPFGADIILNINPEDNGSSMSVL